MNFKKLYQNNKNDLFEALADLIVLGTVICMLYAINIEIIRLTFVIGLVIVVISVVYLNKLVKLYYKYKNVRGTTNGMF